MKAMDKPLLHERIVQAGLHVESGKRHIARQREIAFELERDGHNHVAKAAEKLLILFEELQILHVEHLEKLQRQLADG